MIVEVGASLGWFRTLALVALVALAVYDHSPAKPTPAPAPVPTPAPVPFDPSPPNPGPLPPPSPFNPSPISVDPDSLAGVSRDYYLTLPGTFRSIGQAVKAGQIKDENTLRSAIGSHSTALINAMEKAIKDGVDPRTRGIANPAALGDAFNQSARAMEAR